MCYFARFGTICKILKNGKKTHMEECYILLSFPFDGILFSLIIAFIRCAICSLLLSNDVFNIPQTMPDGPDAFFLFIHWIVTATLVLRIEGAGPSASLTIGNSWLGQEKPTLRRFL